MSKNTLAHLSWRAAIKAYDPSKKLSEQQVRLLIEAARMAPTSYGIQPFKLIVVSNQDTKAKLSEAGYNQAQFTDASHIFVFAARTEMTEQDLQDFAARIVRDRKTTENEMEGYAQGLWGSFKAKTKEQHHQWAARQAYLALGMTLAEAARAEIDTTPMEGFDPDAFDQILGLTDYHAVVVMAAGVRKPEDKYLEKEKVRKTVKELVTLVK